MSTDYNAALERLEKLGARGEMRLNLEIPERLAELLQHPERAYPTIHVAGTNGKGSTVTKIAKALEIAGYKVGRYTSPHLTSYRERISVNDVCISEEEVAKHAQKLFPFIDKDAIPATFFELTTLLAFDYFREQKVDVAVIETGLGGRLDATNIVRPMLTVITSIAREHVEFLGATLEEIAGEKAGILKPHVPVVLGARAKLAAIEARAAELGSPVFVAPPSSGFYDEENRAIARVALDLLRTHFSLSTAAIEEGLKFRPPCRFEEHGAVIFDVAHNPDGFLRLFEAVQKFYPEKRLHVAVGMSKDKEVEKCLALVAKHAEKIYLLEAKTERAAKTAELADVLRSQGYHSFASETRISSTVLRAVEETKARDALLLICGSFYIMQEARQALLGSQPPANLYDSGEKPPTPAASLSL